MPPTDEQPVAPEGTRARPLILLVEDQSDLRRLYAHQLAISGFDVIEAENGADAVLDTATHAPDVVLMDLSLPVIDGWEATRRLKANPATRSIPVIAFTAHTTHEDIDHALAVGCVAIIAKPFEIHVFLTQVVAVLAQAAQHGRQRAIGTVWEASGG